MTEQTPDEQRPAGVADVPLIVDQMAQLARKRVREGDLAAAQQTAQQARELIAEVR